MSSPQRHLQHRPRPKPSRIAIEAHFPTKQRFPWPTAKLATRNVFQPQNRKQMSESCEITWQYYQQFLFSNYKPSKRPLDWNCTCEKDLIICMSYKQQNFAEALPGRQQRDNDIFGRRRVVKRAKATPARLRGKCAQEPGRREDEGNATWHFKTPEKTKGSANSTVHVHEIEQIVSRQNLQKILRCTVAAKALKAQTAKNFSKGPCSFLSKWSGQDCLNPQLSSCDASRVPWM